MKTLKYIEKPHYDGVSDFATKMNLTPDQAYALKYLLRFGHKVYDGYTIEQSMIVDLAKILPHIYHMMQRILDDNPELKPEANEYLRNFCPLKCISFSDDSNS